MFSASAVALAVGAGLTAYVWEATPGMQNGTL